MNEPIPPRPPLLPPPPPPDPSMPRPPAGPQSLDGNGPPRPPAEPSIGYPGSPASVPGDMTWAGAGTTRRQPAAAPPVIPPQVPPGPGGSGDPSALLARYESGAFGAQASIKVGGAREKTSGRGRLTTAALVAWVAGGVALVAALIVLLVVFLGGGSSLPASNGDAASLLPSRIDGFSVEVEKEPAFFEGMANAEDGAALVVSEKGGSGRAFVAAVILDAAAASSEDSFQRDFERGLANSSEGLGELSDVTLDAVAMRGADISQGDYRKLWWWRPYRDAVVVVFASDERTGRKILEALVEQDSLPQG